MSVTFGQFLINETLPNDYKIKGSVSKKDLKSRMTQLAKERPDEYVTTIDNLKKVGDQVATLEGLSVGLDDIEPVYTSRNKIIADTRNKIKKTKDPMKVEKYLVDAQNKLLDHTKAHPGTMATQAKSGARGNIPQLMKSVTSPVLSMDARGKVIPWLIDKSYSEGLSPADYWVAGGEARMNVIQGQVAIVEPGDLSKILVNSVNNQLVTGSDCGTTNGVMLSTGDPHIVDRYLADKTGTFPRNTLITPEVADALAKKFKSVRVRSPMTCEAGSGLCQKCQGLDEKGNNHKIGTNVGTRAAQAMAEPLTQFVLNAKHGVRVAKTSQKHLPGLKGVRQVLDVPNSFIYKATLAEKGGTVSKIEKAPQGGSYVHVGDVKHYVPPALDVKVKRGMRVEEGDTLSDGIPKPDEVVRHKGLGAGRLHMVNTLHGLYKEQGIDVDKRHLEILAKSQLNHVRVKEEHPDLLKGDLITYQTYKNTLKKNTKKVPLASANGKLLGDDVLHYTAGTRITPVIQTALRNAGISSVLVAENAPDVEFEMSPVSRTPLLNPDWMARLSHRWLKQSLTQGAHFGEQSDIHSTHPVPAYVVGSEFGKKGPHVY